MAVVPNATIGHSLSNSSMLAATLKSAPGRWSSNVSPKILVRAGLSLNFLHR